MDDFESQYADELELMNELECDDDLKVLNSIENLALKPIKNSTNKLNGAVTIGSQINDENEEIPLIEFDSNSYKKKARVDLDTDIVYTIDEPICTSNSDIVITRKSNINNEDLVSKYRKTINFDHLKKSKEINITYLSGEKSKIRMYESEDMYQSIIGEAKSSGLLEKPVEALKLEISSDIINKCKKSMFDAKNDDIDVVEFNNEMLVKSKDETNNHLWVERYTPKSYIDLLSDDGINRLLLTWLKSWDYVVFGKELPSNDKKQQKAEANRQASKKRKRIFDQNEIELEEKLSELDEYKRPKIKVALLSGAPGLGKTTMAHVIANRAGYNVIEMNASDDRSVDAFKQNIESVTQIKGNVTDKNFKPNLLIIDEIDGAPQNSVQVLVNEITENSKKKSKEGPTLLRPIICICNDLYAPSLKQLRPLSIVFQCPAIATHRLAERLHLICEQNNVNADLDALIALSDKSSNDVRSCLNTLQFLSKTVNKISSQIINQLNIGQKDYEKGIFTILNEIFYSSNYKKSVNACKNDAVYSILNRFSYMANLSNNCDIDRLIQALHENYLSIRTRDSNFDSIVIANDWFCFCDYLNRYVKEKQDYAYYGYQKYLPVIFNLLFSTTSQQTKKLQYPHSYFDCITKLAKNENILKHFMSDMSPIARLSYNSHSVLSLDLLPNLIEIIQPNLRAVSTQLFSKNEREKLDNLIKTMILFNINYRQERCADGQYAYVLDPAFDEIIKFSGLKQKKQLCYMIKQQIAREITIEKLKMADKYKNNSNEKLLKVTGNSQNVDLSSSNNTTSSSSSNNNANNFFSSPVGSKTLSIMSKFKNNPAAKKDIMSEQKGSTEKSKEIPKDTNDMFARYFKKTPKATNNSADSIDNTSSAVTAKVDLNNTESINACFPNDVWLKYKEGFINAVRYTVKINKLL